MNVQDIQSQVAQGTAFSSSEVPIEVYHDRQCPGVSKSRLDLIRKSPAHYKAWQDGQDEPKESDAMDFGNAVHTYLLEPALFAGKYSRLPDGIRYDLRTSAFKEWYSEHTGSTVLTAKDYDAVLGIAQSILGNPDVAPYFGSDNVKHVEHSIWWPDPVTGIWCKARLDLWLGCSVIMDLKTTRSADKQSFARSIGDFRYHVQAAMQIDGAQASGYKTDHYMYIAIEKTKPYVTAAYRLIPQAIEAGRRAYQEDLLKLKNAIDYNSWPGYVRGIEDIDLPRWHYDSVDL